MPFALVEGMQSPYSEGRSLVAVALRDDAAADRFITALYARSQSSDLSQTVSTLRGERFVYYAVATPEYHVGAISRYKVMRIWLKEFFLVLLIALLLCSLLLSYWTREYLQRRGEYRLRFATGVPQAL